MHPAVIKARLQLKGLNLTKLAKSKGYKGPEMFSSVINGKLKHPRIEQIIAEAAGIDVSEVGCKRDSADLNQLSQLEQTSAVI